MRFFFIPGQYDGDTVNGHMSRPAALGNDDIIAENPNKYIARHGSGFILAAAVAHCGM